MKATELGSIATKAAIDQAQIDPSVIDEAIFGCVLQGGLGQNPARQVSLGAGVPLGVPNTLINKVCASGMKTVMLGAQSIWAGQNDVVLCGGFESMSQSPHYVTDHRKGKVYGHHPLLDSIMFDGLTDAYQNCLMGVCAEKTADDLGKRKINFEE